MAGLNAEHINPFLIAATKILKDMCFIDAQVGKPFMKNTIFADDTVVIMIGVAGEMHGQVMITLTHEVACDIASKMCMMTVTEMDELSKSAICELGNMIMGNTATVFSTKGIGIDITPPSLCIGSAEIHTAFSKNICIPLTYEGNKVIEFNIALKGE